jgi:hypothetical protein
MMAANAHAMVKRASPVRVVTRHSPVREVIVRKSVSPIRQDGLLAPSPYAHTIGY